MSDQGELFKIDIPEVQLDLSGGFEPIPETVTIEPATPKSNHLLEKELKAELAVRFGPWFEEWVEGDLETKVRMIRDEIEYRLRRTNEVKKTKPSYFIIANRLLKDILGKCGYTAVSCHNPYGEMQPKTYLESTSSNNFIPELLLRFANGNFFGVHLFSQLNVDGGTAVNKASYWFLEARLHGKGEFWLVGEGKALYKGEPKFYEHLEALNGIPQLTGATCYYFRMEMALPAFVDRLVEGLT